VESQPARPQGTPFLIKIAIAIAGVWFVFHLLAPKSETVSAAGWYEGATGYEKALTEQKTTGRPVMVYFHTAWCGYCKSLDRDVFATNTFAQRYGSTLKVAINPEKGRSEASIAHQYGVHGFPTVFVVTSKRSSSPIIGYGGAEDFYDRLDRAMTE
jgi:thiol:disulfide interchange protein